MFGIFRTILALLVVVQHLGPLRILGTYAVFAFYVLSGYLMTLILQKTYGYSKQGFLQYAANRVLRIYPLYLVAAATSVALVVIIGEPETRAFHSQIGIPATSEDVWRNVFLILRIDTGTRLVPPAWALTIELFFYIAIGLGLSRFPAIAGLWLAGSALYTAYMVFGDAAFSYRYFRLAAASLPFSIGAFIFHLKARGYPNRLALDGTPALILLCLALLINSTAAEITTREAAEGIHFYVNLLLVTLLIAHLAARSPPSARARRRDASIGDLSYPIYLLHFQGGLICMLLVPSAKRDTIGFLIGGTIATLVLAQIANVSIESVIRRLRDRIRPTPPNRATSTSPQVGAPQWQRSE